MPRQKSQAAVAPDTQTTGPEAVHSKWAEPYRPIVTNAKIGFELGENKLAKLFVFSFAQDPGEPIKERLKHFGYFYDGKQRTWTVNATPVTREVAQRLAREFVGGPDIAR